MNLAVNANSLKVELFPIILGNNCKVLRSGACPISISLIANFLNLYQLIRFFSAVANVSRADQIHSPTYTYAVNARNYRNSTFVDTHEGLLAIADPFSYLDC